MTAWFSFGSSPRKPVPADEAQELVFGLLRRAGYDMADLKEATLGMLAFKAVLEVNGALGGKGALKSAKAGRNGPCPCGSGRKFKKCCEGAAREPAEASAQKGFEALRDTELLPRFHDLEATGGDFGELAELLAEDPELRKLRFTPKRVSGFLQRFGDEVKRGVLTMPENRDALVARYLREAEGLEVLGDVRSALVRAAGRYRGSKQALRALAAGVGTLDMEAAAAPDPEGVNPVVATIFWSTAADWADAEDELYRAIERLGGKEELARRAAAGDLPASEEFARVLEELDLDALRPLTDSTREWLEDFQERIREGRFSVGLPMASLLPFFVRASELDPDQPGSKQKIADLVVAQANALEPEDLRLFDQCLEGWLSTRDAEDDKDSRKGALYLRRFISGGSLRPFALDLVLAGACYHRAALMPGEEGFWKEEFRSAEWLERYGDFLLDRGYPALARRTWRLCEEVGGLPESVRLKLGPS